MASAGRILIMPKGEWREETEYDMLDVVKHHRTVWIAKRKVVGIEPNSANSDYWMDMFNNLDGTFSGDVTIQRADNGKTVVRKNHSDTADYGTEIIDYDGEGNITKLVVKSQNTLANKVGFVIEDAFYSLYGEHNIKSENFSGTTDSNGFLKPKDITVDTTDILSCRLVSGSGFCTQFNDTDAHWAYKVENWDRTPIANQSVTIKVVYSVIL